MLKQEYELELAEYNSAQGEKSGRRKPQKPAERMLFLPANNSATGMFQLLADNQGQGLIFESEGDTLTQSLRTEISDYSDGFRKAFHHETISYYRRTDREYVSIETPCLSTVISGTPKQVVSLIRNVEDGLFSRFMFYYLNARPEFKEVFAPNPHGNLDLYYRELGKELLALHERLLQQEDLWVRLSEPQIQRFYTFFRRILAKYRNLKQEEYTGTINRLGVVAFRLCMLFTVFRTLEDGQLGSPRTCSDLDFEGVLSMIGVLVRHSSRMFNLLPEETQLKKKNNPKELFFEQLPAEFGRSFFMEQAARLHIKPKTAENYIRQFVEGKMLQHPEYNRYINLSLLNDAAGGGTGKELGAG